MTPLPGWETATPTAYQVAECAATLTAAIDEDAPTAEVDTRLKDGAVHITVKTPGLGYTHALELLWAINATPATGTANTPGLTGVTGVACRYGVSAFITVRF